MVSIPYQPYFPMTDLSLALFSFSFVEFLSWITFVVLSFAYLAIIVLESRSENSRHCESLCLFSALSGGPLFNAQGNNARMCFMC